MCVCVTNEEVKAGSFVWNISKSQISGLINTLFGGVHDEEMRHKLYIEYSSMNAIRAKRDELVVFHGQVKYILLDRELCDSGLLQVFTEKD